MSPTLNQRLKTFAGRPLLRRTLFGLIAALALYAVLGAVLLPYVLKTQVERVVTDKLQRPTTIASVRFNPFTLVLTVRELQVREVGGAADFVRFERLVVKLAAESLLRLAPVVQMVHLQKPYVRLVRNDAHHYNVDDLIALLASLPPAPEPARFSVNNIELDGGHIEFADLPDHLVHTVADIRLGVPFISSLPSEVEIFVEPHLSAQVNGTPFAFLGRARPYAETRVASLELNLEQLDLTRFVDYLPHHPAFKVGGAKLDLHLHASFRQPKSQTPNLTLSGTVELKSVRLTTSAGQPLLKLPRLAVTLDKFDPLSGLIDLQRVVVDGLELNLTRGRDGNLNLLRPAAPATGAAGGSAMRLHLGQLELHGASLHYSDEQASAQLRVEADKFDLDLRQLKLDSGQRTVDIGAISSGSAALLLRQGAVSAVAPPAAPSTEAAYTVRLGQADLDQWQLRLEDRRRAEPVVFDLRPLHLTLKNVSSTDGGNIDFRSGINGAGRLGAKGRFGLRPLAAELTLDASAVDLLALQSYFGDQVNLRLTSAALDTHGSLRLAQGADGAWKGGFKGGLRLANVATVNKISANDFLRWKSLQLDGIDVQLAPLSVAIEQVALKEFFARVILDKSGRINLQDILPPKSKPEAQAQAEPAANAKPPRVTIGKLSLEAGRVRYTDNFIKPNYTANLQDLGGTVAGLSSDPASRATVDLQGQVNAAPLHIAGRINPLKGDLSLDLNATVRGMELSPLSPYSLRYAGYGIDKGKLSFEVAYQLEQRKLTAQNKLTLDQLRFGAASTEPGATSLPVHFALALLQDRDGVVEINLPIEGSIDDPQFSLAGLVGKMIGNLIVKAVSAPFTLLASLFGGGEEMSSMDFDAGHAALPAAGQNTLQALAKALSARPALRLDITGRSDAEVDRAALQRVTLERKVRALKSRDLQAHGSVPASAAVVVDPAEYAALLTRVYREEKFAKPTNAIGLNKTLPVAEMEQLIIANTVIDDDALRVLGNRRAEAAKAQLVSVGGIDAGRIYIVEAKPGAARVDFGLK